MPTEMEIDIQKGGKKNVVTPEMEQGRASQPHNKLDADRDSDKTGKKRGKSNQTFDSERTGKEDDEYGSDEASHSTPPPGSPKRSKKIKIEREQTLARERTRSKTRIKTTHLS